MIFTIAALTGVELLLIYFFSRRLSRPIERVSQGLRSVEELSFAHAAPATSKIKEIFELQSAVALFETSLRSFSSFVPLDVVKKLIKTGTPLTLGVEQRFMTVLFTDLKDFSTLAEHMPANELLAQLSRSSFESDRGRTRHRGQAHRRWHHGFLGRARPPHRPCVVRLPWRPAGDEPHAPDQRCVEE
jgi:hypothetical protein